MGKTKPGYNSDGGNRNCTRTRPHPAYSPFIEASWWRKWSFWHIYIWNSYGLFTRNLFLEYQSQKELYRIKQPSELDWCRYILKLDVSRQRSFHHFRNCSNQICNCTYPYYPSALNDVKHPYISKKNWVDMSGPYVFIEKSQSCFRIFKLASRTL